MITGKRFTFILLTFIFAAGLFFTQAGILFAQDKPDALKLYRQGRSLDSIGRREDLRIWILMPYIHGAFFDWADIRTPNWYVVMP